MKVENNITVIDRLLCSQASVKYLAGIFACLIFLFLGCGSDQAGQAKTGWPHIAYSKGGLPISYEVYGTGEPTLVFVHGWSCDSRYWREQLPYFSKTHRVVTLDLAGHGHSGMARRRYTMRAFGEDVKAVTDAVGGKSVILIGHSMGGSVIVEAARLMPKQVIGLIGIDTLENIEFKMTGQDVKKMTNPLKKDFQAGTRAFVGQMISPNTDAGLRDWILADITAQPPAIALSAMEEMMSQYITGEAARIFKEVRIPVVTVNGDKWPVNYEANRRHMKSYEAIILAKADHFLMMDRPEEFNKALEKAIKMIPNKTVK